jgi:carboxymethylenebutenolidase
VNRDDMVALWQQHTVYELVTRDADGAVSTMVEDAAVMHLPTMSGGFGREDLRVYYRDVFIPGIPQGTTSELVDRSVGDQLIVEESIMVTPHDQEIPFLLPGVAPTGRLIEAPFVVIVKFRGDLMESERLYWDQAAVLAQVDLIPTRGLPFADVTQVTKFLREKVIA